MNPTTDRTNITNTGYAFGGKDYEYQNRTDANGNQYKVDVLKGSAPAYNTVPNVSTTTVGNQNKMTQVLRMQNKLTQISQGRGQVTDGEITKNADGSLVTDNYQDPILPQGSSPIYGTVNGQSNRIIGYNTPNIRDGSLRPTYLDSNSSTPAKSPEQQETDRIVDSILARTDAQTAQTISSIRQKYENLRNQQKQINESQAAKTQNTLLTGGVTGKGSSAQYAPLSSDNLVTAQLNYGLQQIAKLDAEEQDLIIQAQQAGETQNFRVLEKRLAQIENIRQEKQQAEQKLKDKQIEKEEEYNKKILEIQKNNQLASLYEQGITDPASLLKALNANGGDFTLKEVREGVTNLGLSAEEKAEKTALQSLFKSISEKGVVSPAQMAYLTKNATTVDDFYALGGGDFLAEGETKFIEMPDGSTLLVNAKTGETIKNYGNKPTEQGETTSNEMAYARQFAIDGKLPSLTDLQKLGTTPARITELAKELPKQNGEIVSTQTGVKNTSIPAAAQEDFVRLYNITQNVKKLKELDEKRVGGLVSGTVGKVLGSADQAAYLTARKAIVDDLSRMQSGAALSLDEVAFYEDYLPGRFSEFLALGTDSMDKINNFETQMNRKLTNGLNSNGLSIYGYSTVNLGGKDYKVGEEIEVNGVKGRVLPDGTVSVKSNPISSGGQKGVVSGVNITKYATDPQHENKIATIVQKLETVPVTPQGIDSYIKKVAPNSPITGEMVTKASSKYNVDPKLVVAIIQNDSSFGTKGKAVRTKNAGNYGNDDDGNLMTFDTWDSGIMAVAKWLEKNKVS